MSVALRGRWLQVRSCGVADIVSVLLALSFLAIPVRCDAALAPHSIFLSPAQSGVAIEHSHSSSPSSHRQPSQGKAVHSKSAALEAELHDPRYICGDDVAERETDTKSQAPVGATFDLPIQSVVQRSGFVPPPSDECTLTLPQPGCLSEGAAVAPDPPPPKPVNV